MDLWEIIQKIGFLGLNNNKTFNRKYCALKYVLGNKIKIDKLILVSGFNNYLASDGNDIHNKINTNYYV